MRKMRGRRDVKGARANVKCSGVVGVGEGQAGRCEEDVGQGGLGGVGGGAVNGRVGEGA